MSNMRRLLADGPQRMSLGSLWLLLGSIALLIAQQTYEPPPAENEDDEAAQENGPATAKTAVALASLVMSFALLTLILLVLVIRTINGKERETENFRERQKERGAIDTFLDPQFPSSNPTIKRRNEFYRKVSWSSLSRILLMAPSVALFLVIVVRLFLGAGNFEGVPHTLDFGWKYGLLPHDRDVESDGDELYNEPAEKSLSFVVEFNTYGHAVQGFLAALLAVPVVSGFLINLGRCTGMIYNVWKNLILLTPWALTIYPSYNLTKRFAKAGEAFAGSSFGNNGFEWAAGFMMGLSIGSLITAIVMYIYISREKEHEDEEQSLANNEEEEEDTSSPPWWKVWEPDREDADTTEAQEQPGPCAKILQILLGLLLLFTVFAASVLFGTTWHGCLDGSPDECVNYSEDDKAPSNIMAGFVVIPSIIVVGAVILECRR